MPSQRKRIGFLPSEEVHKIIDKLCRANEFSQSKVTGLLVEEALRSRGVLSNNFPLNKNEEMIFLKNHFDRESLNKKNISPRNRDVNSVNKKLFTDDIKLMHEFIEYKYFKKVMEQNRNLFE